MSKVKIDKGSTFERYEKKYLLNQQQFTRLLAALGEQMQMDEYGLHTICTLYYDTADFSVIRRCLEKPSFKQKLRLRSYGVPAPGGTVYLELKKKMAGITYKRRIPLPLTEADNYMENACPPTQQGQIFSEIDWYTRQQPLQGKAIICYDRVALLDREDLSLRVTLDANIRWRGYHLSLYKGDYGTLLLPNSCRLMEIKTMNALPYWLSQLLSHHRIYPTSYSKYGTVYSQYLAGKEGMRHAG